ncbi:MAG: PAS domain S-box protein [Syntrophales bacterium]|nr:PAS domain S-box protein [Syntrophales bacterium]
MDARVREEAGDDGEMYRLIVDNANEVIFVVQDGYVCFVNPKILQVSGYSCEELYGMPLAEIVHPDDRERVFECHARIIDGNKVRNVRSHRIIDKSGRVRWLEVSVARVLWKGRPALLIFASDRGKRKQQKGALLESERRYNSLFSSMPVGAVHFDRSLCVLEVNERFATTFGSPRKSFVGMDLSALHDKRIVPCLSMALKGEEGRYEGGFRIAERSAELWVLVNTLPLYRLDGGLEGGIGMFQDVTDRKSAELMMRGKEEELLLKSRHLEEANMAIQVVLRHSEEDLIELQKNVLFNIEEMVMPLVRKLKAYHGSGRMGGYVDLLSMNLREIASPLLKNMALNHFNLTPQERQIAVLIRNGLRTDEMADKLSLSRRSVEHHRYKIRNKLGLRHKKTNLRTALLSLSDRE